MRALFLNSDRLTAFGKMFVVYFLGSYIFNFVMFIGVLKNEGFAEHSLVHLLGLFPFVNLVTVWF